MKMSHLRIAPAITVVLWGRIASCRGRLKTCTTTSISRMFLGIVLTLVPGTLSAAHPISLTGKVVGPNAAPVAGAIVSIQGTELETLTDATGKFTLSDSPFPLAKMDGKAQAVSATVIKVYHSDYIPFHKDIAQPSGDLGNIQLEAINFALNRSVIRVNKTFTFMKAHVLFWPDGLCGKLGQLKKHAYMAYPKVKPAGKLPLLIALHGAGGKPRDLETYLRRAAGLKNENGKYADGIKGLGLADLSKQNIVLLEPSSSARWNPDTLNVMLDYILETYADIDKRRIYVMGHSMGGSGTWSWITKNPERFAAAAVGSQGGNRGPYDVLKELPIWLMLAQSDNSGKLEGGRGNELAEGLQKVSTAEVKITVFPGANHAGGNEGMFSHPELIKWMLKFSLRE